VIRIEIMSEELKKAIDDFLTKNDKVVLSYVHSPEFTKWWNAYFYGVKS